MRTEDSLISNLKKITIGDLVTTYHSGYFVVTKIKRRWVTQSDIPYKKANVGDECASLIYYKKVFDENFKMQNSKKIECCDEAYCDLVTNKTIDDIAAELNDRLNSLKIMRGLIKGDKQTVGTKKKN